MNKDWTDKAPQAKFPQLLYDRACSWVFFVIGCFAFIGALGSTYDPNICLESFIAGLLAFIASILLENRARQS